MWVKFTSSFDWKPTPQTLRAYLSGMVRNVPTPCATEAIAKGAAIKMRKPHKKAEPHEDQG